MSKDKRESIKPESLAKRGKKGELSDAELNEVSGGDAANKGTTTTSSSSTTPTESVSLNFTKTRF